VQTAIEAVKCAKDHADSVEIGAEDATRTEVEFLLEFCAEVIHAGADIVNISDTVGYAQPAEIANLVTYIISHISALENGKAKLSVHCHNDLGLAAANTLAAIEAGASQAELTLLGIGERAGNASLDEFVMTLAARKDYYHGIHTGINPELLAEGSRLLSQITGQLVSPFKPVVGRNISAHGSGIHQNGIMANPETYELFPTESSGGFPPRFVMTRHSGSSGLSRAIKDLTGIELPSNAIASLMEQYKTISDTMNIVTSTEIIRLLVREKIIDSEIWELADFREVRGSSDSLFHIEIKSSKGESRSFSSRGTIVWECISGILNPLFGYDIRCEEYSFSLVGNSIQQTGRFYLCALYNGKRYHEEFLGSNENILCVKAYLDIVNSIICGKSTAIHIAK
jgi:2-isopropylmalate synthase